jgi:replicative DNA helicase
MRSIRRTASAVRSGFQVWLHGAESAASVPVAEVGVHGSRGALVRPSHWKPSIDDRDRALAEDDLLWDQIVAVEPLGELPVYDATVEEHHSFIAEGLVLHNSIEQDADIVGFIYRDEVYDEDSPDKGIAELIIAKHRNGATGVVKLAFLNHLTKFANLARGSSRWHGRR